MPLPLIPHSAAITPAVIPKQNVDSLLASEGQMEMGWNGNCCIDSDTGRWGADRQVAFQAAFDKNTHPLCHFCLTAQ